MPARWVNVEAIGSYCESPSDTRHPRNRKHLLVDIVVIAVRGMVCGRDGPTAIHRWASNRREWPEQFLTLPDGIPRRDCIRRPLMAPKPGSFQGCFQEWITPAIRTDERGRARLIAIDGKANRRPHSASQQLGPLHIVGAWAGEQGIAPGRVATEEKSNEITAIPLFLGRIDLTNSPITIDAMGCQKERARDIVEGGGDLVIGVKDNRPELREAIETYFDKHLGRDLEDLGYRSHEASEAAHGRTDERSYFLTEVPADFAVRGEWPWVQAIGSALRVTRHADGREADETRSYIPSRYLSGKRFSGAVRGHRGIESMPWALDVNFREDDSRTRGRTLGGNLSWLRRFAVTLLKRHPIKDSPRGKMIRCMMNTQFLTEVLTFQQD